MLQLLLDLGNRPHRRMQVRQRHRPRVRVDEVDIAGQRGVKANRRRRRERAGPQEGGAQTADDLLKGLPERSQQEVVE